MGIAGADPSTSQPSPVQRRQPTPSLQLREKSWGVPGVGKSAPAPKLSKVAPETWLVPAWWEQRHPGLRRESPPASSFGRSLTVALAGHDEAPTPTGRSGPSEGISVLPAQLCHLSQVQTSDTSAPPSEGPSQPTRRGLRRGRCGVCSAACLAQAGSLCGSDDGDVLLLGG